MILCSGEREPLYCSVTSHLQCSLMTISSILVGNERLSRTIINGTNFLLKRFLLTKWNLSETANLLHVATELNSAELLDAVYDDKTSNQFTIVKSNEEAAIEFAADKLHLVALNCLLKRYPDPIGVFEKIVKKNSGKLQKEQYQNPRTGQLRD